MPLIKAIRPTATRASCWRWARLRWSLSICAWLGVPDMQGSGSSGLHMPGAANLAKIASEHRPRFGGELAADRDVAVAALLALGHPRRAGAFGVLGFGAVLIEQEQSQRGGVLEFLGADADGHPDQVDFDLRAGDRVDPSRELVHRLAQHLDVVAVDQPAGLGGGHGGQQWRQRLLRSTPVAAPAARLR